MAYHVPFSQRPSGMSQRRPPIYIGFDEPRNFPRPKFNWWGFNGLFLCLVSFGLLSPITLLISLVGLRRRPRKLAVAGTFFSLVGVGIMATIALGCNLGTSTSSTRAAYGSSATCRVKAS